MLSYVLRNVLVCVFVQLLPFPCFSFAVFYIIPLTLSRFLPPFWLSLFLPFVYIHLFCTCARVFFFIPTSLYCLPVLILCLPGPKKWASYSSPLFLTDPCRRKPKDVGCWPRSKTTSEVISDTHTHIHQKRKEKKMIWLLSKCIAKNYIFTNHVFNIIPPLSLFLFERLYVWLCLVVWPLYVWVCYKPNLFAPVCVCVCASLNWLQV